MLSRQLPSIPPASPAPAEVRENLARILESEEFQRTGRSRILLQFVVDAALDGDAASLKESVIGVRVFGRPADYDPKIDPVVRVSMGRVRTKLEQYYSRTGAAETVRIEIPKGAYIPVFKRIAGQVSLAPRRRTPWMAIAIAVGVSAIVAGVWLLRPAQPPTLERLRPLATSGSPQNPAFSSAGDVLAFDAEAPGEHFRNIYVQRLDASSPVRLSHDAVNEVCPAWSPDGRRIAFLRSAEPDRIGVFIIAANGGGERKLTELHRGAAPSLSWSADGKWLAAAEPVPPAAAGVVLISPVSGEKRILTKPPDKWRGDSVPVFSPDSTTIAFRRTEPTSGSEDIFEVPVQGGAVRRVTFDRRGISGAAILPDRSLLFASKRGSSIPTLWWRSANGSRLLRVTSPATSAAHPVVSQINNRLAFVAIYLNVGIWCIRTESDAPARPFLTSEMTDINPRYSRDGSRIVFHSARSGTDSIWISRGDGSGARLLVDGKGAAIDNPDWSPDGRTVVFEWHPAERGEIYVVPVGGGAPRKMLADGFESQSPVYSHDGKFVFFASNRSGRFEIWRMSAEGGGAIPVTTQGARSAVFSPDGAYLFFSTEAPMDTRDLWRVPFRDNAPAGSAERVIEGLAPADRSNWTASNAGVYYIQRRPDHTAAIEFLDLATRKTQTVYVLTKLPAYAGGMAISPDAKDLLFTQVDRDGSGIFVE